MSTTNNNSETEQQLPGSENIPAAKKDRLKLVKKYPVAFTILLALIVLFIVYKWKDVQGKNEKKAVEKMATEQLLQTNQDMLKLLSKPLVWSIRAEMLRNNLEQVNIFTNDLVKEKNFQVIYLIDPAGTIIISTDKKMEGQSAIGMFDPSLITSDSTVVFNKGDSLLTLSSPVMGYDKRLGTLVFNYIPVKFIPAGNEK